MYNFALRVANLLDAATETGEFSAILIDKKDALDIDFDADLVRNACAALVETSKQDVDLLASLNLESLDSSTTDFLLCLAMAMGQCDVEHLKVCEGHRSVLNAAFSGLLAGLAGVDLRAELRKVQAVEQLTNSLAALFDLSSAMEQRRLEVARLWAGLMLDAENVMAIASVLSEAPSDQRDEVMIRTLQHAVALEERPDPAKLRELAMQAFRSL